ncbi:hypothetical protein BCV72DRAFT_258995 [Rhizopus microsporus var. microsporus]|nr:hypothetical protein BCV72DRAFT_258995 [Rhizopus microsporus var. microsporus]
MLFPQHSAFLIGLFDVNSSTVLGEARQKLCEHFNDLEISIRGFYKHIREKCSISLKTIELPAGVNFCENYVFIDETGFHSQLMRSRAWSKAGNPVIVKVHTQKGVNISIVGCSSPFGTICFSKLKKGTSAYHIVKFMKSVMDILDKHSKKGMFNVMDNCKIQHSYFVVDVTNKRGYKTLFMPPYSPFLNPIEGCWFKIKKNIRRSPLDKSNMLTPRIAEACKQVTVTNCQGWIRHAESHWDRCIQKEMGLK